MVISCRTAVLQNNSQWLFLDILKNATRSIFQFVIRITNSKCPNKRILILILTDSVIIHIRYIIYTVLLHTEAIQKDVEYA